MHFVITGGAGFIGLNLTQLLIKKQHSVTIIDDFSSAVIKKLPHHPQITILKTSILNEIAVKRAIKQCDGVYHLAAIVGVKRVVENPTLTYHVNVEGTRKIVSACARYGKKLIFTSSSEVYGKSPQLPFNESDSVTFGPTTVPRWAYGISKYAAEQICLEQVKKTTIVITRLFNTIGPQQSSAYGMVIPRFFDQAKKNVPMTIYGDGLQKRCFISVHDVVDALVKLMEKLITSGTILNLGSDKPTTILDLAKKIRLITHSTSPFEFIPLKIIYNTPFDEPKNRKPDLKKIKQLIDIKKLQSLTQILEEIYES